MTVHIAYLADEQAGAPTGVRIVEPPPDTQQAQRGNLYALVDLQGPPGQAAPLTERVLSAMQRTYYTAKGTQSQVLTDTISSAQQLLQAETSADAANWRIGVICVGLLRDRLALAGLGDAFAFVTTDGGAVNVCPPDRLSAAANLDDLLALWPLHRQKIETGGALIAGGAEWLEQLSPRMLAGAAAFVTPENCQDAADGLREQAGVTDIPGLLLVFAWDDEGNGGAGTGDAGAPPPSRPSGPVPPAPPVEPSTRSYVTPAPTDYTVGSGPSAAAPRVQRAVVAGLPTALNATPPVVSAPALADDLEPSPALHSQASGAGGGPWMGSSAPASSAAAYYTPSKHAAPVYPPSVYGESPPAEAAAPAAAPPPASFDSSPAPEPSLGAALAAGAVTGFNRARGMFASILPDRSSQNEPRYLATAPTVGPGAGPYAPPPVASGSRARIFVAIAVILLLLVPAVVAGMYWQQGASNRAEAESLLDLAEARLLSAQDALDQEDQGTARALLTEAYDYVLQSEEILGRTTRSSGLIEEIRAEQQQVMQVQPLYGLTTPLATFGADASPQRVLVIDQDVYVLDTGRGQVLKYRLDANGETLAEQEQIVLREGEVVNGVPVGRLVDVAWQSPIPGYEDKASLLLLDGNNRVFRYNQVDGSTLVSFGDPSPWQGATQLEVFSDRLYVADEPLNQIYRYAPGTYQDPPTPWFQPTTQVRLQGIEAMRIDGDIWLLFNDGKVVRYHAGEQVPFSLDDSVALPADPVDLYISSAVNDPTLYLADAAEERILFFNKDSGEFQGQFQASEGRPLRGLRSIFIDEVRGTLFLLTQEALYAQRLPR
jgi:hypothetical protein